MSHTYYSQRKGTNPNLSGLPLTDVVDIFIRVLNQLVEDGYFHEAFGYECVDAGYVEGNVRDIPLEILLTIRKKDLWPIHTQAKFYSEDDFFDVIEFLHLHISKPLDGHFHSYGECGMHWHKFNKAEGQFEYRRKINSVLSHYVGGFEISADGAVLQTPEAGFEQIFDADIPSKDKSITNRSNAAILSYRKHGSSLDDRRQAVRDLSDVLEYLRPQVKSLLTSSDESDLFNIANNFGLRHHKEKQKTSYDTGIWLSWMFYFYLATIHVVMRKINQQDRS